MKGESPASCRKTQDVKVARVQHQERDCSRQAVGLCTPERWPHSDWLAGCRERLNEVLKSFSSLCHPEDSSHYRTSWWAVTVVDTQRVKSKTIVSVVVRKNTTAVKCTLYVRYHKFKQKTLLLFIVLLHILPLLVSLLSFFLGHKQFTFGSKNYPLLSVTTVDV